MHLWPVRHSRPARSLIRTHALPIIREGLSLHVRMGLEQRRRWVGRGCHVGLWGAKLLPWKRDGLLGVSVIEPLWPPKDVARLPLRGRPSFSCNGATVKDVDIVRQPDGNCFETLPDVVKYSLHGHDVARVERIGGDNMAIKLVRLAVDNPGSRISIANTFNC